MYKLFLGALPLPPRFFIILISWFFLPKMTLLTCEVDEGWIGLLFWSCFLISEIVSTGKSLVFILISLISLTPGNVSSLRPTRFCLLTLKICRPCPSVIWISIRARRTLKPKQANVRKTIIKILERKTTDLLDHCTDILIYLLCMLSWLWKTEAFRLFKYSFEHDQGSNVWQPGINQFYTKRLSKECYIML